MADPAYTSVSQVPHSAESISVEWLDDLLCRRLPHAKVTGVEVTGGSDGTSSRRSLRVTYDGARPGDDLPERFFTKAAPHLRSRLTLVPAGSMLNESSFYRYVRPHLDVEMPKAYFAGYEPGSGRSMIVLEDLSWSKGASYCDPATVVSSEQAHDMVDVMAGYHGAYWNNASLFNNSFPWLKGTFEYQSMFNRMLPWKEAYEAGFDRAAEQIGPEIAAAGRERVWHAYMRSIRPQSSTPQTLLVWDTHVGNWYTTDQGRMGLLDAGMVRGEWGGDVSYAVSSALTTENRRQWERSLVERYLDRVRLATGQEIGFDSAWSTYRQQMLHGFVWWVMTYGAGLLLPDMQPDWISIVNIERMAAAITDLGTIAATAV